MQERRTFWKLWHFRVLCVTGFIFMTVVAFCYGVGVGFYHWPPFETLSALKKASKNIKKTSLIFKKTSLNINPPGDSGWSKNTIVLTPGKAHPDIAFDEAKERYIMVYLETTTGKVKYAIASKNDPHNWTDQATTILKPGSAGSWDETDGRGFCLLQYDGTWYLYYDDKGSGKIGIAIGIDIESLAKYESNPILIGDGILGSYEEYVRHPYVMSPIESPDNKWHMIYDGRANIPTSAIGDLRHATSSDGLNWIKDDANNPVLSPSFAEDWEADDIGSPTIIKIEEIYYMGYHGYNEDYGNQINDYPHWIGIATSTDLVNWQKGTHNPTLPFGGNSTFDERASFGPAWHDPGDGVLYLYYSGLSVSGNRQIGYATTSIVSSNARNR